MKNLFLIMGCVLLVALSASCARDCKCTYFEDGKKVAVRSSSGEGIKYYDKTECKLGSQKEQEITVCKVNCYDEVGEQPSYYDYEDYEAYEKAYVAWEKALNDCLEMNTKKVKAKLECK